MDRLYELKKIFGKIDDDKRTVIEPLLEDVVFLESRLRKLRALPLLRVHPKNPEKQETTPAGKQYKEYMQSYLNAIKVLQTMLYREGESGESPLVRVLKEFELDG